MFNSACPRIEDVIALILGMAAGEITRLSLE
jgi:hypothetical protein